MVILQLPGGSIIPYLTTAERTAWEAQNPIDGSLVIDSDLDKLYYWDNSAGVSVEIPIGSGGGGDEHFTTDFTATIGQTKINIPGLVGATVWKVSRQGIGRRVVTAATTNTMEVYFDSTTGDINLATGDSFEDAEWIQVEYSGVAQIVSP